MEIKILGTDCSKCNALEKATREMVAELNIDALVVQEHDIMKILEYGILRTPGLVINGKLVLSGRVPSQDELRKFLSKQ